ncbi:MAG TPA: hypothetical protein VFI06_08180 [Chitinophagaceae bacterium]|nr:hypothetical protein [Chitinophagaceae bacterium]
MKILFTLAAILCLSFISQAQKKIDREGFSMQYPQGWTIDTADEDYDADALFSLDSPDGDNMIMFVIYDMALDTADLMKEQVTAFTAELLKKPVISHFNTWGKYKGSGKILKGKLMGVYKGFVRIFIYTDGKKTMTVVEQCFDKAYEELKKDYDLMASSFEFKKT